jgi:hypothetical protein
MTRLRGHSRRFRERLLALHWQQWATLGIAAQVAPGEEWLIDPEALIASTLRLKAADPRLAGMAGEWLAANGEWVNQARLQRVFRAFDDGSAKPATRALQAEMESLASCRSRERKSRRKSVAPSVQRPALLRLTLRGLMGMDARADILTFLLAGKRGSSLAIARQVYHDQKGTYRILEKWCITGVVTKRAGGYALTRSHEWLQLLGIKRLPGYVDWVTVLASLDRLALRLSGVEGGDPYVASSLFRDAGESLAEPFADIGLSIPDPTWSPGNDYLAPFARFLDEHFTRLFGSRGLVSRKS